MRFRHVMKYRRIDIFQKSRSVCYGFVATADYGFAIVVKLMLSSGKRMFWVRSNTRQYKRLFRFCVPYRFFRFMYEQSLFKIKFLRHCPFFILLLIFLRMSWYDSTTKSIKKFVSDNISNQHFDNSVTSFFSNTFLATFNFVCRESNIFSKFKISWFVVTFKSL